MKLKAVKIRDRNGRLGKLGNTPADDHHAGEKAVADGLERWRIEMAVYRPTRILGRVYGLQRADMESGFYFYQFRPFAEQYSWSLHFFSEPPC